MLRHLCTYVSVRFPDHGLLVSILIFFFLLTACGSGGGGGGSEPDSNVVVTVGESTLIEPAAAKTMQELQVDNDFDWSVTQDITLALTLYELDGSAFIGQRINIFSTTDIESENPMASASLLFSGWPNSLGTLQLNHKVRKGNEILLLQVAGRDENDVVGIEIPTPDSSGESNHIEMSIYL